MENAIQNHQHGSSLAGSTFIVSVNEKGRMTLPAKVRQLLHLPAESSMVEIFVQPDGSIAIQGRLPTVAETAGAVMPLAQSKDWKEMEAIIREEVAEHYRSEPDQ